MLQKALQGMLAAVALLIFLPMTYIVVTATIGHLSARWETAELCEQVDEGDAAHATVQLFVEHSCSFSEDERPRFPTWCIHDDQGASKCFSECPAMSPVVPQQGEVSYTQLGAHLERYTCAVNFDEGRVSSKEWYGWWG
jgi:hypothetical protein